MKKLDLDYIAQNGTATPETIRALQVAIYVACGGGLLGRLAAEQPADFYVDDRVGHLPYVKKEIMQAVSVLAALAGKVGFNPHNMPKMADFHNCGIW